MNAPASNAVITVLKQNPLLWLLVFVPIVLIVEIIRPDAAVTLFVLSVLAIIPLAGLLALTTGTVAERIGDVAGGLLNASLGNLTEIVIALTALSAGEYLLVKSSIAGAIVTNILFMMGMCFLVGGVRYRVMEFNVAGARLQALQLFLASVVLLIPSAVQSSRGTELGTFTQTLSVWLAVVLIATYCLGLLFSLKTHSDLMASAEHGHSEGSDPWPLMVALPLLGVVTVFVALVSHVFVASVQIAAIALGMSHAFVGFIVVALVGAAAEITAAVSGARRNRLDLSVSISLGSAAQIALFVAPVLVMASYFIGPEPMNLQFLSGEVLMVLIAAVAATQITSQGRAAWFSGVLMLGVYLVFAITIYLLPPG